MDRDGPSTAICLRDSDPFNVVIGVIIANVTVTVTAIVGGGGGSGGGSGSSIHHHPQQLQSAIVSTDSTSMPGSLRCEYTYERMLSICVVLFAFSSMPVPDSHMSIHMCTYAQRHAIHTWMQIELWIDTHCAWHARLLHRW